MSVFILIPLCEKARDRLDGALQWNSAFNNVWTWFLLVEMFNYDPACHLKVVLA
jgi:hypothetical protein